MLSDEIRARLAQIHATQPREQPNPHIAIGLHSPHAAGPIRHEPAPDLFERGQECAADCGTFLRFRRQLSGFELRPAGPTGLLAEDAAAVPARARARLELQALAEHFPAGTVFLDLETCGFAGSPIFLIGLVWQPEGTLVLDQLFARTYLEERALLEHFWQIATANRVLVTFNGKSFDWPMLQDRSTRHRLGCARPADAGSRARGASASCGPPETQLAHCDLLHHARRRWKRVLPNCRLQTLERFVCGRARYNDLDGALVPAAYHHFVRTGQTHEIGAILKHNALDLITLVELALKLTSPPVIRVASA